MPKFRGGDLNAFSQWVTRRVVYPRYAQHLGIQGEVMVQFVIEKNGSVSNIKVISKTQEVLNDEVIRIVSSSPKWTPGTLKGEAVRVKMILPVDFSLRR